MRFLKKFAVARKAHATWKGLRRPDAFGRWQQGKFDRNYILPPLTSPTAEESKLIEELRKKVAAFPPEVATAATPPAETKWMNFKNELRGLILTEDPRNFLTWEVVRNTMGGSVRRRDYQALARLPFWKEWERKIIKIPRIAEKPYFKHPDINGTTLAHVRSLAQPMLHFNENVADADYVVEFGGGYGSLCAVVYALGFAGTYVIFDLPEFLLLQEFYLKLHRVDTSRVRFVSTFEQLEEALKDMPPHAKSFLVATWSLSETSEGLRDTFFSIYKPTSYLIAYQRSFGGVDNHAYFKKFAEAHADVAWKDYPIANLPGEGNRFLVGIRSR